MSIDHQRRSVSIRPRSFLLAGFVWLAGACRPPHLNATQSGSVEKWLNCDECNAGQREAVKGLGNEALPRLHELLLGYPSPAEMKVFTRQAQNAYRMTRPSGVSEE